MGGAFIHKTVPNLNLGSPGRSLHILASRKTGGRLTPFPYNEHKKC